MLSCRKSALFLSEHLDPEVFDENTLLINLLLVSDNIDSAII